MDAHTFRVFALILEVIEVVALIAIGGLLGRILAVLTPPRRAHARTSTDDDLTVPLPPIKSGQSRRT